MAGDYLPLKEAARVMGISETALRRRIKAGTVDCRMERRAQGYFYLVAVPEGLPDEQQRVTPAQMEVAVLRAERRALEAELAAAREAFAAATAAFAEARAAQEERLRRYEETQALLIAARLLPASGQYVDVESRRDERVERQGDAQVAEGGHPPAVPPSARRWWQFWKG